MAIFLSENGVLTMGNKTPVTILQETLHRKGLNPQYELIYNGVGTMDPLFKYRVSAAGSTAIGEGKSKKEAKHDAAATLLKRMHIERNQSAGTENPEAQGTESITSPYSGALKENFVGMLDETCVINKIPLPFYVQIEEEGPPHARIFTMQCKVSECSEVAVARTKKQAKHMVAQQMIARIADILGDRYISPVEKPVETEPQEESPTLKAIESGTYRHDMSIRLIDSHNVFHLRTEEFLLPPAFMDLPTRSEVFYEELENSKAFLDELVRGMEGTCKVNSTSPMALNEAMEEIEKDCHMIWYGDDESFLEEEEKENDSADANEDKSYLHEFILEEFEFSSDEDDNHISSNPQPNPEVKMKIGSEEEENDSELFKEKVPTIVLEHCLERLELETNHSVTKPVIILLSVECPQGAWVFRGSGATQEAAVDNAAVRALKFLRVMAIPSDNKKETRSEAS